MGCWNETCGVTQLPILAGEKVRLFILINQALKVDGGGTCYANDIWTPAGAPIKGEYDDYGGIENIVENSANQLLLEKLKESWIPFEKKFEEIPPVSEMTLEQALYFIERNYAKVTNKYGTETHLGIMFVLEDVYQSMINFDPIACHHDWSNKSYYYKPFSQMLRAELEKWYTKMQKLTTQFKDTQDLASVMIELASFGDSFMFSDYRDHANRLFKDPLISLAKENIPYDDARVQEMAGYVLEMMQFESSFVAARKMWIPQSGKGSQQYELDVYNEINKATKKVFASRKKRYAGRDKPNKEGYYPYMLEHNAKQGA